MVTLLTRIQGTIGMLSVIASLMAGCHLVSKYKGNMHKLGIALVMVFIVWLAGSNIIPSAVFYLAGNTQQTAITCVNIIIEGSTTAGITIELGENNAVEVEAVVEFLSCVYGILTGHGVNHEEGFVWTEMILEIADLVHHLLINGKTSGCIDDYHIVAVGLSLLDSMVGDTEHILVLWLAVYRNTHLLTHYMELLDSCRTVNVAGHEQWLLAFLGLEHIGKLSAEGSLTRTLQTAHEDDGRKPKADKSQINNY